MNAMGDLLRLNEKAHYWLVHYQFSFSVAMAMTPGQSSELASISLDEQCNMER